MDIAIIEQYADRLLAGDPLLLGIAGGGVLLLLSVLMVRATRRAALRRAPRLRIDAFQLSPLGHDASLKISNVSEPLVLTALLIHGRQDVVVKNTVAGHTLPTGGTYRILLESQGKERLAADFEVEFFYTTAARKAYRQRFQLKPVKEVKLVKA
ncbi:MAG: hypothetical protein D6772_01305 [Bacteroidetes bacterium]|nr:MAG: hypothetical protein D6772_01305 [Bacteroidota bacterium]